MKIRFAFLPIVLAAAGCSTTYEAPTSVAASEAPPSAVIGPNGRPMTGTRLSERSTDRNVRSIGAKEYKDTFLVNSLGNEIVRPSP